MWFEQIDSFDYSTTESNNESIQDKIDAKKLEISELTKEGLTELKVDIQDSNSSLTLRDNDGNFLWKVRDNEVLIYEGETKTVDYKWLQKLFLKVRTKTGKVWFVSADYLKAKVNQDRIHIKNPENKNTNLDSWSNQNSIVDTNKTKTKSVDINNSNSNIVLNDTVDIDNVSTNKSIDNELDNNSVTINWNENSSETIDITPTPTEQELSKWLMYNISKIKAITEDTENLETLWVIWDNKQWVENNQQILNEIYTDTLIILSKLKEINTPTALIEVEKMHLFLAEYFSDNKDGIENDHHRNYTLSTVNALWVIKKVDWCPTFPDLTKIQSEYPDENDFKREVQLAMEAFDARFEDFSHKIQTQDQDILTAISIIEDNRWIGWFDFAEDVTDAIYQNIGGVWAMLAGTVAIILASPGIVIWWVIAWTSALIWAWINAVSKWESNWKEFWADAASLSIQVWAAWSIALKSSAILAKTTWVWKTAWILGAEATADVTLVWVFGEWVHESIEWKEMQWWKSFQENLIWAPLVLLGGWKTLFRETMEKAQLRKAIWDTDGMLTEMKILNRQLTDVKEKFSWKWFNVDVDGQNYFVEISNIWELKLANSQRILDPNIKADKKIIEALATKIHQANIKGDFTNWKIHLESEKVSHTKVNQESQTIIEKSEVENIQVALDESTWLIKFDGWKYQIINNNSFYFTSPKNGKLYRIETWDKGEITKVYNNDSTRNPNQSLDGKEYSLSWSAKWAVIKNNIHEIRDNYSVKVDKKWNIISWKTTRETLDFSTAEKFTHKTNGKIYYRDNNWQLYNEKWHKSNVKENNLDKVVENTYAKETIPQDEYLKFRDQWKVSDQRLDSIAKKHRKWEPLSKYETEILHSDIPKWDAEIRVWKEEEKAKSMKSEETNKSRDELDYEIENIDISKMIKEDLNALKKWESVEYTDWIKVTKTSEGNYLIWDNLFYSIDNASDAIHKLVGKKAYKLIIDWWNKELINKRKNLLNKEFWTEDNTFKIDNDWILRIKEKNGSYKKVNLEELSSKQQDIIINELLWSKWYTLFNKAIDKLSSSTKKLGEIYDWDFWKKLKESKPKSIKSIEWVYNQSIWDYIQEIIKSWKAEKYNKLFLARTLITWKHSESFWISSWLPTKGKTLTILWISGAEAATGNFSWDDYLWNYAEVVMLWWLWTLILETPTLYDTWKAYAGFWSEAIDSMERN